MVDAIVSLAVEKLADLVIQEADFLGEVKDRVKSLKDELKRMQRFLKDADRRQHQDESVRGWISDIRNLTYDSEDIIETFILNIATSRRGGGCGLIDKCASIFTKLPDLHQIGNQIESIRKRIEDISTSMQRYGIEFAAEKDDEMQRRIRRSYPHEEEEHFISFEAVTKDLKAQLMRKDQRVRVVSIVGMGGLGKTTLAKKVYNDIRVRQHFDCHSWNFISQQFSPRDVLTGILMEVASNRDKSKLQEEIEAKSKTKKTKEELAYRSLLDKLKEEELVTTLHDVLKEKRYLVVLDDIWKTEAWDSLKHAFPNGIAGSKVLFTTRIRDVAFYADRWSTPIEPPLLNEGEGWELLRKKAFPKDAIIEPEYEKLGRQIVKECEGLPLAIAVIGGLLATKPLQHWKMVQRNINGQFTKLQQENQYGGVYSILALSYHNLPFHLKPCFLYLSQFPEDWQIKKKTLIRMWIAEGFVLQFTQGEEDETVEDVAEQYLEELVSRCMIQVSQRDHTGIGVKICRMHDLVRDICVKKARDENFLGVVEHREYRAAPSETFFSTVTSQSRRVAIHPRTFVHGRSEQLACVPLLKRGDYQPRSLFYFVENNTFRMTKQQGIEIFQNFRLLRVLNIVKVKQYFGYLPSELGNLIHLRYLGLRGAGLSKMDEYVLYQPTALPASISKLRRLYTLDLRNNSSIILPDVVWKLECLRHLLVDRYVEGLHRLDSLRNLETLKRVKAKSLIRKDAVMHMTNLRNLEADFQRKVEVEMVLKSPCFPFGRLRSLKMKMPMGGSFPNLKALSGCHDLTKAIFSGSLSHSLEFLPPSLMKLALRDCNLNQDSMVILEQLPNLRFLSLEFDAFQGSEIAFSAHGFRKLEILRLQGMKMEEWRIEEGAMPCLKTLQLERLEKLRMIPEGLKFVTSLQKLKFVGHIMTDKFEKRVKVIEGVEGEDFDKVKHIPSISFDN